jgi:hypothetical protein
MIAVAKKIPRSFVPGKRVSQLLYGPSRRGMVSDRQVNDPARIMGEEH